MTSRQNDDIAERLDEIAALLSEQAANPYRVRAYRRAATTLRQLAVPVSQILAQHGAAGLEDLPRIGPGLARTIRDIVVHGYSPVLERLRGDSDAVRLFASVPGIGNRLAARLHDELGLDTLQQLETATHDADLNRSPDLDPSDWRASATRSPFGSRECVWTIITAAFGPLRGRRIVRGREIDCSTFYPARPLTATGAATAHGELSAILASRESGTSMR